MRLCVRSVASSSGLALFFLSATVLGQAPAAAQAPTAPAAGTAKAPVSPTPEAESPEAGAESAAAESTASESDPSAPAADETPDTATSEESSAASEQTPGPQQTEKPEPAAPKETIPAPEPATSAQPQPLVEDDYDGATDAALVEEKPGPKNLSLGVALDLTLPLGKTADFVKSASLQGLSLDLRYYAWGNIGIGAGVALDSLSKKSTETATWENATITGTQVRELSYTPITLKGYYAWREQQRFVPYVAAGLGAARAVKRLTVGISSLAEASWHFAVVPEAGLQIPVGPTLILTNVRLNYLPPSAGVGEHLFANLSLGLSIQ